MRTSLRLLFAAVLVFLLAVPQGYAAEEGGDGQVDAVHHILDANTLDFEPLGEVALPRLFVVRRADGSLGFDAFASTEAAEASGRYHMAPAAEEGHGEEAAAEEVAHGEGVLAPVAGEVLVDLSITRHVFFMLLAAFLVGLVFIGLARSYKQGDGRTSAPKGTWKNMWEVVIIYIRDEVAKPNLGRHYKKYVPYLLSVFFFVLFANLLGLVPFGSTATANITVTAVLAVFTFVVTQLSATKEYWKHIFWPPGPVVIKPLIIPAEILGLFTKPFALAVRLFANMVAGHLVLLNIIGLIFLFAAGFGAAAGWGVSIFSVFFSLFLYALETLVAFIQAYVFTILSALFIGMAIVEHHEEEHAYDEAAEPAF